MLTYKLLDEWLIGEWLIGEWLIGEWLIGEWLIGEWLVGEWWMSWCIPCIAKICCAEGIFTCGESGCI